MEFPIIDITSRKLEDPDGHPLLLDEYIHKKGPFETHFKNRFYCDCNGQVYQAIDHIVQKKIRGGFFSFLPVVYIDYLVFQKVEMKLVVEQLRSFALDYIKGYQDDKSKRDLIDRVKTAKDIREILWGW